MPQRAKAPVLLIAVQVALWIVCVVVQAALDMSGWPRNWQAAVVRVLEIVTKLPEALPFAEPVPMDEVPGYREQIPNPMDLGTVLGRAKADAYDTPLETLDDVRQVGRLLLSFVISRSSTPQLGITPTPVYIYILQT